MNIFELSYHLTPIFGAVTLPFVVKQFLLSIKRPQPEQMSLNLAEISSWNNQLNVETKTQRVTLPKETDFVFDGIL